MATKTSKPAKPAAKASKSASKKVDDKPSQTSAKPTAVKKSTARPKKTGDELYTDPALRHRLKDKIQEGDKGGKAGQWSARKAQLLAVEYEKAGGGYRESGRAEKQQHLEKWTDEHWQTADGSKAVKGETTSRYLPEKAWEELTPAEKKATDDKKKKASRTGKQFVSNTGAAKKARKKAE